MLLIPVSGPVGWMIGYPWLTPATIFVLVPLLDIGLGEDRSNATEESVHRWPTYHHLVPHAYVFLWQACLLWTAHALRYAEFEPDKVMWSVVSASIASAFATCAAHEILHRPGKPGQWVARFTMATCCYGHFVVEHLHHHATAGVVQHGTVARPGESIYSFIGRNIVFGLRNAYRVAERMRRGRKQRWIYNRTVQQHVLTCALAFLWALGFGWKGLVLFAVQAGIAVVAVETVQYFEHYALVRLPRQPLRACHSWNSNGWLTNALTLNITRHSDHHLHPELPYQRLRVMDGGAIMPAGYFGLAWLAIVPAIWRRVIDERVPMELRAARERVNS